MALHINPPFVIALISSGLAPCTNLERSYVSGRTVYDGNLFETVLLSLLRLLFPCILFLQSICIHDTVRWIYHFPWTALGK
jgi:hypothetical protein